MSKLYDFIDRTLDTSITPLAYLYGVKSVLLGISYGLISQYSVGVQNTILYREGALVGHNLWGLFALVGGIVLIIGMLSKRSSMVRAAALLLAMTWVFAAIVYGVAGVWLFLFPTAVIELLCCGYLYLSVGLGRLWNYTPTRS